MAAQVVTPWTYKGKFRTNSIIHGDVLIKLPMDPETFRGQFDFEMTIFYRGWYNPGAASVHWRMTGVATDASLTCRSVDMDPRAMRITIVIMRGSVNHQYFTEKPYSTGILSDICRIDQQ